MSKADPSTSSNDPAPAASATRKRGAVYRRRFYAALRVLMLGAVVLSVVAWSFSLTRDAYTALTVAVSKQTTQQVCLARPGVAPEMVLLPGKIFNMGSSESEPERAPNEQLHKVTVRSFAIGRCEVTFAEYDAYAEATGRDRPDDGGWGRGRRPVIDVSFEDAMAYAEWLAEQTGQTYCLPTEAEWEYAARAGTTTPFWFGETISIEKANYNGTFSYNGGPTGKFRGQTVEVGQFEANAFGLYDVHGNAMEWTCSAYDADYQDGERTCAAADAEVNRVARGGSWGDTPRRLRSANRFSDEPSGRYNDIGFRLARELP